MCNVIVEHVFFNATAISDNHLQLIYCTPKYNDFWENFLSRYRPHLLHHIPYSPFELPLYEVSGLIEAWEKIVLETFSIHSFMRWVNLLQAFCWSYGDIFIILLAIGINFRFNQFNDYFRFVLKNESLMTQSTWRDLRVHYFQLIDLVYFIDSHVSGLILISMGHSMLILIVKIFNAFK